MREELLNLLAARKGHFRYESGHHGDLWLEIPALYLRPDRLGPSPRSWPVGSLRMAWRRSVARWSKGRCWRRWSPRSWAPSSISRSSSLAREAMACTRSDTASRTPSAHARDKVTAVVDDVINAGSAVRGAVADLRTCRREAGRHRRAPGPGHLGPGLRRKRGHAAGASL